MATIRFKRRWAEEDPNTGNTYLVLHSDDLASAGEKKCYARVLRMDIGPAEQTALSNGQAVAMEIDPETLIPSPKESKSIWPHAPKE